MCAMKGHFPRNVTYLIFKVCVNDEIEFLESPHESTLTVYKTMKLQKMGIMFVSSSSV